jgi:hypothetical protein
VRCELVLDGRRAYPVAVALAVAAVIPVIVNPDTRKDWMGTGAEITTVTARATATVNRVALL